MTNEKILIVEDESIFARSLERMLVEYKYAVIGITSNGEDALKLAEKGEPDLVLMDIKLIGTMDGEDAAALIRSRFGIPVIYLTALGDNTTIERAKDTGPFGYIYKPIDKKLLRTTIEMALYKHKMEGNLRESEKRFRSLFNNAPTGILYVNTTGGIEDVNQKLLEILGSPSEEETRKINMFTFEPLIKAGVSDAFRKCIQSGKSSLWEHPYVSKWGKRSIVRYTLNPVKDENNSVIGVQANVEDVTEQVQAKNALRESEEQLKIMFEYTPDAYYICDLKGNFIDGNKAAEELIGYRKEELVGKNFLKLKILGLRDISKATKLLALNATGKPTGPDEFTLHRGDGSTMVAEILTCPVEIHNRTVVLGIARDITERNRMTEMEHQYLKDRDFLSQASMGFLSLPPEKNVYDYITETVSSIQKNSLIASTSYDRDSDTFRVMSVTGLGKNMKKVIKLLGKDPIGMEVSTSDTIKTLMMTGTLTRVQEDIHEQIQGGVGKNIARSIKKMLGFGNTYVIGMVDQGVIFGACGIILRKGETIEKPEIIETFVNQAAMAIKRKEAEEALRLSEETFRTLTSLSPVGIYSTDAHGKYTYANRRWCQITGMSYEEAMGDGWKNGIHPDDMSMIEEAWEDLVRSKGSWGREYRFVNKNGDAIWVYGLATPLYSNEDVVTGYIGINLNITQRKLVEAEKQHLLEVLEEKRRELQSVIYIASHDLRTPLVNVQGFSKELNSSIAEIGEILKRDDIPADVRESTRKLFTEDIGESMHYIDKSIVKMESLINGLLHISRLGAAHLNIEELNMNTFMKGIRETFEYRIKESGTSLTIDDLPNCHGDTDQINQVFSNILDNAIKYLSPERPGEISITGWKEGNHAIYSIQDNGMGMAPDHQDRIFEIFQRLNENDVEGDGLGLTAVRKILDRHDGRIWVESEEGTGSAFFVVLPCE